MLEADNKDREKVFQWQESVKSLSTLVARRTKDLDICQEENKVLKDKLAELSSLDSEVCSV